MAYCIFGQLALIIGQLLNSIDGVQTKQRFVIFAFGLVVPVETAYRRWAAGHHVTPCALVMFRNH